MNADERGARASEILDQTAAWLSDNDPLGLLTSPADLGYLHSHRKLRECGDYRPTEQQLAWLEGILLRLPIREVVTL